MLIWSASLSSANRFRMYSRTCYSLCLTVTQYYPFSQVFLFPYLYFKFTCWSNIINDILLFKYPISSDTAYLGGIVINICIWFGPASAFNCSTWGFTQASQYFSNIFLNLLYITIRLYFGIITIWYLQISLVYDNVAMSFIASTPPIIYCDRQTIRIIAWGVFFHFFNSFIQSNSDPRIAHGIESYQNHAWKTWYEPAL